MCVGGRDVIEVVIITMCTTDVEKIVYMYMYDVL